MNDCIIDIVKWPDRIRRHISGKVLIFTQNIDLNTNYDIVNHRILALKLDA